MEGEGLGDLVTCDDIRLTDGRHTGGGVTCDQFSQTFPCIFAYRKESNTGGGNSLGMRLDANRGCLAINKVRARPATRGVVATCVYNVTLWYTTRDWLSTHSVCTIGLGFAAFMLIHHYDKFESSLAIPK